MISPTLPALTPDTAPFWTGGLEGELRITTCKDCARLVHPPQPVCPDCWGDTAPRVVSGRARLLSYSVNHQPWFAGQSVPFAFIAAELVEQANLVLMSRIEGAIDNLQIGEPLEVVFHPEGEIALPLFRRCGAQAQ